MQRLVTPAHDGTDKISRPWIYRIIINLNLVAWSGDKNFDVDHGCLADHFSQRLCEKNIHANVHFRSRKPIIQAWIQEKVCLPIMQAPRGQEHVPPGNF